MKSFVVHSLGMWLCSVAICNCMLRVWGVDGEGWTVLLIDQLHTLHAVFVPPLAPCALRIWFITTSRHPFFMPPLSPREIFTPISCRVSCCARHAFAPRFHPTAPAQHAARSRNNIHSAQVSLLLLFLSAATSTSPAGIPTAGCAVIFENARSVLCACGGDTICPFYKLHFCWASLQIAMGL